MKKLMILLLLGAIMQAAGAQEKVYKMSEIAIDEDNTGHMTYRHRTQEEPMPKLDGLCRLVDSLPSNYNLIEFKNGIFDGIWQEYTDGQLVSDGSFRDGKREGVFKRYFRNGERKLLAEAPFTNGDLHGTLKIYHLNGNLKLEEQFKMGLNDGFRRDYDSLGVLTRETFLRDGYTVDKEENPIEVPIDGTTDDDWRSDAAKEHSNQLIIASDSVQNCHATAHYEGQTCSIDQLYTLASPLINYPQKCSEQGIEGRVVIHFTISEQNQIEDIEVLSSPDKALTEEVIRILRLFSYQHEMLQGKLVKTEYTFFAIFKL